MSGCPLSTSTAHPLWPQVSMCIFPAAPNLGVASCAGPERGSAHKRFLFDVLSRALQKLPLVKLLAQPGILYQENKPGKNRDREFFSHHQKMLSSDPKILSSAQGTRIQGSHLRLLNWVYPRPLNPPWCFWGKLGETLGRTLSCHLPDSRGWSSTDSSNPKIWPWGRSKGYLLSRKCPHFPILDLAQPWLPYLVNKSASFPVLFWLLGEAFLESFTYWVPSPRTQCPHRCSWHALSVSALSPKALDVLGQTRSTGYGVDRKYEWFGQADWGREGKKVSYLWITALIHKRNPCPVFYGEIATKIPVALNVPRSFSFPSLPLPQTQFTCLWLPLCDLIDFRDFHTSHISYSSKSWSYRASTHIFCS